MVGAEYDKLCMRLSKRASGNARSFKSGHVDARIMMLMLIMINLLPCSFDFIAIMKVDLDSFTHTP